MDPSRVAIFMSDLIEEQLQHYDTDEERIQCLDDAMRSLYVFQDFVSDMFDAMVEVCMPDANVLLTHALWNDLNDDKNMRFLWNEAQTLLDDLRSQ